jgi:hypothetical protein
MRVMWPLPPALKKSTNLGLEAQMDRLPGPGDDQLRARPVGLEVALVVVPGDRPLEVGLGVIASTLAQSVRPCRGAASP